jgi:hypothetical protein
MSLRKHWKPDGCRSSVEPSTHQKMLDQQLDLALQGSNSLNTRGTTLAGLLGTTIAFFSAAAVRAVGEGNDLNGSALVVTACLFVLAMTSLGACVVVSLTAVRPNQESSSRLQHVVDELMWDRFDEEKVRRSTWLAIAAQRQVNQRKSELMRTAYVLAGIGIVAAVLATGVYCFAFSG